jgi:mono/diheme cytochrome c family protein
MKMKSIHKVGLFFTGIVTLSACNHDFSHIEEHKTPRAEFAPNMYYSEAYEPYRQVDDESAGTTFDADEDDNIGEYYNSNPYNRSSANNYTATNLREPAPNTIKRGFVPYAIGKDSVGIAARTLRNPLPETEEVLKDGEVLYKRYCAHCHGETGAGDGPVNNALKGVANLTSETNKALPEGHIYHVITHGIRRMWPHGSQVNQTERWKIVHYVKNVLQNSEQAQ